MDDVPYHRPRILASEAPDRIMEINFTEIREFNE